MLASPVLCLIVPFLLFIWLNASIASSISWELGLSLLYWTRLLREFSSKGNPTNVRNLFVAWIAAMLEEYETMPLLFRRFPREVKYCCMAGSCFTSLEVVLSCCVWLPFSCLSL